MLLVLNTDTPTFLILQLQRLLERIPSISWRVLVTDDGTIAKRRRRQSSFIRSWAMLESTTNGAFSLNTTVTVLYHLSIAQFIRFLYNTEHELQAVPPFIFKTTSQFDEISRQFVTNKNKQHRVYCEWIGNLSHEYSWYSQLAKYVSITPASLVHGDMNVAATGRWVVLSSTSFARTSNCS